MGNHRLTAAHSTVCVECFTDLAIDQLFECSECALSDDLAIAEVCEIHDLLIEAVRVCPPDQEKIDEYNALYEVKFGKETP